MKKLYTPSKIYHYADKLDTLEAEVKEIRPPLHVRIKPTNTCGHDCYYCAYRVSNLDLGKDMEKADSIPKDKMLEIIDDLSDMGVWAVTFSGGGDPFVYRHLLVAAKRLATTKIKFASLTNAALLKGEVAEVFAHKATWLRVSIDGWDSESYASYRGVSQNEFSKVINNINAFQKLGGSCYLGVVIIVDQKNAPHVLELIELIRNAGAHSVKISPCIVSNDGKVNNEYHASIYDRVKEQIDRARSDFEGETFEIFDAFHTQLETFEKAYTWCPYLQIRPVIGADLRVYSCQDKAYDIERGSLGSIKDQRFKDFWFSDKNNFFKINPSQHCNHHCVAHGQNLQVLEYLSAHPDHLAFV